MESRRLKERTVICRVMFVLLSWSIALFPPVFSQGEEPEPKDSLLRLLPLESDLKGWELDGKPETAKGMGLFELINGGAEEYVKAGFSRAVIATYRNNQGKRLNLDVYEMLSVESAANIYRKKAGERGRKVPVGDEAAAEDYYLNFRKGIYHVTLSGYDSQKETLESLLHMARLVAERISVSP